MYERTQTWSAWSFWTWLGLHGQSWRYGPADESEALAVLRRYFELGGNFLDTAEIYGPYKNEELIARFLREVPRDRIILATKFGFRIDPDGQFAGLIALLPTFGRHAKEVFAV